MNRRNFIMADVKSQCSCFAALLLAGFILNACSSDEETVEGTLSAEHNLYIIDNDTISYSTSEVAKPFNTTEEKINSALENYAVTMLIDHSKDDKKNTMLSPMSATLFYSMISNLTDETSGNQYQRQLGLENFNSDNVSSYCRKLNYQVKSSEKANTNGSKFSMSNNCWIQEKESVYQSFVSMTKSYGIGVKGVDLRSQSGLNAIGQSLNGASFSKTNGTGMTSLGNVTSVFSTSMDLQRTWKNKLNYVKDSIFTNADGTVSFCKKLGGTFKLKYDHLDSFDMVEVPYSDDVFSLYIVYPHSSNLLNQTLNYIQDNGIEKCIDKLIENEVSVYIPVFKLEGVTELNSSTTSSESVDKQFYQAKLTKASPKGFNIGNTYQAYHIELNPKGTSVEVESSGTVINVGVGTGKSTGYTGASSGGNASIRKFHVDRPFIIFIRNNKLKTIAYACCIKDLRN